MFEIFGEDLILKFLFIFDNKCIALISPVYNVGIDRIFEYFIGFDNEIRNLRLFLLIDGIGFFVNNG